MMMELPNELLTDIILPYLDLKSILQVASTCKRLNNLAKNTIKYHIDLTF